YCVVFFFSSRRRHTRFDCDWSSDVCSSDLLRRRQDPGRGAQVFARAEGAGEAAESRIRSALPGQHKAAARTTYEPCVVLARLVRSEERRVGKGLRIRRDAVRYKVKMESCSV